MSAVQGFEFGGDSEAIKNRFSTTSTKLSGFTNFVTFTNYCDQQSMASKKQEGESSSDEEVDYDSIIKRYAKVIADGVKRTDEGKEKKDDKYGEYKYSDQFFYQKVFENYKCTGGGSMDYGQLPEEYKEILKKCMKTWDSRVTKERREIIQQGILLYGVTYSMDLARGDTNIDNPKYLDCSSFVGQCYWRSGVATEGRAAASWSTPTNSSGIFNKIDSSESIPGDIGQQCWPGNAGGADHTGIYIGKTTTVNGIIKMLKKHGLSVLCAAPTGRAAKRMEEATHHKSMTIHRTLEVKSEGSHGFKFSKNETSPLEGDALIIDESSMIDMSLLDSVLKAIPNGMKLILVGDIDQLLSVGCGNVLYEMIHSGKVPVVRLKAIFRQDEESGIVVNAHKINRGEIPLFKNRKEGDYFFMNVDDMEQEQIRDSIVDYVCDKLPKYYNIPANEIQVLSPMRKGHTGVWELNSYIQNRLNPPAKNKPVIPCNEQVLRLGDKVMFTCNDYDKNIFNGDIGKIVSIFSPELDAKMGINDDEMDDDIDKDERGGLKRGFIVDFDGNRVCFDNSRASDFILAYAITIHKSQGSEYDIVVMPLTMANYTMLQRNLLYTAVTRAKKIFVLFGQKNAVAKAVKNLKVVKRNTRLGLRIVNQMGLLDMMQPENVQLSIDGCGDPRPCLIHASVARGIMAV